jgi:6-phosphofructokinase 1
MRQIAVLTSGGDAPGMNAAIRAVVRAAHAEGWSSWGIEDGFQGLLDGGFRPLGVRDVGGIIQQGGTVLGSARCKAFTTEAGVRRGLEQLEAHEVDALVVFGGNGSPTGAHALHSAGFPGVGIASTIDNDLRGSDITIGVDTALNVGLESIDRLRTTASSLNRGFLVEVMGRNCGYLALMLGIAGGAEAIVIPEAEIEPQDVATLMQEAFSRGKSHAFVVVAEGARNNAGVLAPYLRTKETVLGFDVRTTILGHVQRGGTPTAFDRLLATRLGVGAIWHLARERFGMLVGLRRNEVTGRPLEEVAGKTKPIDLRLLEMARDLAR